MISIKLDIDKNRRQDLDLSSLRDLYSFNVVFETPPTWVERAAIFDPYTVYTSLKVEKTDMKFAIALKKLLNNSPKFEKLKLVINDFDEIQITRKDTAKSVYEKLIEI